MIASNLLPKELIKIRKKEDRFSTHKIKIQFSNYQLIKQEGKIY